MGKSLVSPPTGRGMMLAVSGGNLDRGCSVKVVFLEEVEGSGRTGEVRNVADGYARNYLLPRKLAVPATDHNIRIAQARVQAGAKHQAGLDAEAAVLAEKLPGLTITIEVRAGEQGRLYGSVTTRDIAEALEKPLGLLLEHRQVELEEPIRRVGLFEVPLRLSRNVRASVQVAVLGEGQTLEELLAPPPTEEEQASERVEVEVEQEQEEQPSERVEVEQEQEQEEQPSEKVEVEQEEQPSQKAEVEEPKKAPRSRRKDKGAQP
ncbi:MAG: 50S ribosomal protein L9 [Dehalococcoidia bacterium]|nr:50S ribosomal protein L9 [Dehalococcoidia bacterium]